MTQEIINVGNVPNDRTGDNLRVAGNKINDNFTELYEVIQEDRINLRSTYTPGSAVGADGDSIGDIAYDADYLYVCVADFDGTTAIWRRAAIGTW